MGRSFHGQYPKELLTPEEYEELGRQLLEALEKAAQKESLAVKKI